jgi:hypothetical protein
MCIEKISECKNFHPLLSLTRCYANFEWAKQMRSRFVSK